jgi:hypothetical protein
MIAKELNVPVLALAQLSRTVEQIKPAIPRLNHLRDSGSIEQDADVVMFIYRKAADRNYRPEEIPPEEQNLAEIHIAKHRNGPTGMCRLFFDKKRASFQNLELRRGAAPPPPAADANNAGFAPLATPQNAPGQAPPPMAPPPVDPNPQAGAAPTAPPMAPPPVDPNPGETG